MNRIVTSAFAILFSAAATTTLAHDDKRLHNAVIGEILSITAEGFQLKTKTDTVTVKFSSKTKFERDKKVVGKTDVHKGEQAAVVGTKLPTGEVMANEVLLGLPAERPASEADSAPKAKDPHHKHP